MTFPTLIVEHGQYQPLIPPRRLTSSHKEVGSSKMVMKIELYWYEKLSDDLKADEYSADIDDEESILCSLDLHEEPQIFAGVFNVLPRWIGILQPYFQHVIEPSLFDYQISFRYQGAWPPPPKQPKKAC